MTVGATDCGTDDEYTCAAGWGCVLYTNCGTVFTSIGWPFVVPYGELDGSTPPYAVGEMPAPDMGIGTPYDGCAFGTGMGIAPPPPPMRPVPAEERRRWRRLCRRLGLCTRRNAISSSAYGSKPLLRLEL
jgi:hypothetical protein